MQFEKKAIVIAVLIALSIIAWGFFLNSTGLAIERIINFASIEENFSTIISLNFLLFALLLPLTPALVFALAANSNEKQTMLFSALGSIAGIAASLALFASIQAFFIAMLFLIFGVLLAVKTAFVRLSELKKFVWFRVSGESSQKIMVLTGVGLLVGTALFALQNQEQVINELEQGLLEKAFGSQSLENAAVLGAEMQVQLSRQALEQVSSLPEFQKLKEKQDSDVALFVARVELLKANIDNPALEEELTQKIQQDPNFQSLRQNVSFSLIKEQFPIIQTIENYYWLIAALALFGVFTALANIIITPLSILYGLIIASIVKASSGMQLEKKPKEKKQAEKKTLTPLKKTTLKP